MSETPGPPVGEGERTPEREGIRITPEVARSVISTANPRYLDLGRPVRGEERGRVKEVLMGEERADLRPQARMLARSIMKTSEEQRTTRKEAYLRLDVDRYINDHLADSDRDPQATKALELLSTQIQRESNGREDLSADYIFDNYRFPEGDTEQEIIGKIEEKRRGFMDALVEGSRREDDTVNMQELRGMLQKLHPIIKSKGLLWSTMAEGILRQPAEEKGEMIDSVLAVQGLPPEANRGAFAEMERFSGPMEYQAASVPGIRLKGAKTIEEGGYHYNEDAFLTPYNEYLPDQGKPAGSDARVLNATLDSGLSQEEKWAQALHLAQYTERTSARLSAEAIYRLKDKVKDLIAEGEIQGLATLSDGVGGHGGGETASSLGEVLFTDYVVNNIHEERDKEKLLRDALVHTNNIILEVQDSHPLLAEMGATFLGALTDDKGETFITQIGDSRIYEVSTEIDERTKESAYDVQLLTADDSMIWGLLGPTYDGKVFAISDLFSNPNRSLVTAVLGTRREDFGDAVETTRGIFLSENKKLHLVCDGVWEVGKPYTGTLDPSAIISTIDSQFARDIKTMDIEDAKKKAMAELYKQVNLAGLTNEAFLAQHLTRTEIQEASYDNVTAVVYGPSIDSGDSSKKKSRLEIGATDKGPSVERRVLQETRSDIVGDARSMVTPGIAKALLASIDPDYYDPETVVRNSDKKRLLKQLTELPSIDFETSARARVSADPEFTNAPKEEVQREIFIKAGERERLIKGLVSKHRLGGGINMVGLLLDLREIDKEIAEVDRDMIYLTMAQAILSLPKDEKRRVLEQAITIGEEPLERDEELFRGLYAGREQQQETKGWPRRKLLAAGLTVAGAAGVAAIADLFVGSGAGPSGPTPEASGASPEISPVENFAHPFSSKEANEIAQELEINAGSFLYVRPDHPDDPIFQNIAKDAGVNGFLAADTLLPIFSPAVTEQQQALEEAAKIEGVPVNVLGTIATMESAGELTANSGVAAGLMQIDIGFNLDKFISTAKAMGITIPNADAYLTKWKSLSGEAQTNYGNSLSEPGKGKGDPDVKNALANASLSARVGAQILKEYYDSVKVNNSYNSHDPNNPITWSLALGCYNGGLSRATESYYNQPTEMQLYQVHALRFFMTAEIAAQLRNRQMKDSDIEKQLVSEEVDARAYAYSENDTGIKSITDYLNVWIPLSKNPISANTTQLTASLKGDYDAYFQAPKFTYPVSPGLRLWIENGGLGQWEKVATNTDHNNYPKGTYLG